MIHDEMLSIFEECMSPGWDSYDAEPISAVTFAQANSLLPHLWTIYGREYVQIVPCSNGSIQFEGHHCGLDWEIVVWAQVAGEERDI